MLWHLNVIKRATGSLARSLSGTAEIELRPILSEAGKPRHSPRNSPSRWATGLPPSEGLHMLEYRHGFQTSARSHGFEDFATSLSQSSWKGHATELKAAPPTKGPERTQTLRLLGPKAYYRLASGAHRAHKTSM